MDDLEINKENNSFRERIDFINKFIESNNAQDDNFKLQKYFEKFSSRYNAKVSIEGDIPSNYKINARLNGYLNTCLLYTSPSPRDRYISRMPSSA